MADTLPPSDRLAVAVAGDEANSPSRDAILAAFERQQAHQWTIRRRSAAERVQKLKDLKRAIVADREAILDAMHADFRKNRSEAELSEIQLVLTELNEAIAKVPTWMEPVPVSTPVHAFGTRSRIQYRAARRRADHGGLELSVRAALCSPDRRRRRGQLRDAAAIGTGAAHVGGGTADSRNRFRARRSRDDRRRSRIRA